MKAIQTICWVALLTATINLLQQQGLLEIIAKQVGLRDELVEKLKKENDAGNGTEENNNTAPEAEQPSGENSEVNRRNVREFLRN